MSHTCGTNQRPFGCPARRRSVPRHVADLPRQRGAGWHAWGAGTGGAGTGGAGTGGTGPGGPLRLAPVPHAVADTAWLLTSADDVRAVVEDALSSGRCTLDELAAELNEGPIRGSAALRAVLTSLTDLTDASHTAATS